MFATDEQIAILLKLQEVDRRGLRAQKALKQLPHPAQAAEVRSKREEVAAKFAKVSELFDRESGKIDKLELEDRQLSEKIAKVQEKIDTAEGNYRSVETWTRDMQIMSKRREDLGDKMTESLTKLAKIEKVKDQAEAVVRQLEQKERKLYEQFQQESGAIKDEIVKCQEAGKLFASKLSSELLAKYTNAVRACGGVGVSICAEGACTACRNAIPANKLPDLKAQAPLAECPNCHRILIMR